MNLPDFVVTAIEKGVQVTVDKLDGVFRIDMNTRMKSECVLYAVENGWEAHMRYKEVKPVANWDDLVSAVSGCVYGKGFGCGTWFAILKAEGYKAEDL